MVFVINPGGANFFGDTIPWGRGIEAFFFIHKKYPDPDKNRIWKTRYLHRKLVHTQLLPVTVYTLFSLLVRYPCLQNKKLVLENDLQLAPKILPNRIRVPYLGLKSIKKIETIKMPLRKT